MPDKFNQKKFIPLINGLDRWLGTLYSDLLAMQAQILKLKSSLDSDLKKELLIPANSLISELSEFKNFLENQRESLSILKRTPPGRASSVIDFLYNVVVDPSSPSQKEEYYKKLKNLDKATYKGTSEEGSMFGMSSPLHESRIDNQANKSVAQWFNLGYFENKNKNELIQIEENLAASTKHLMKSASSEEALAKAAADFTNSIKQIFKDPTTIESVIGQYFKDIEGNLLQVTKEPSNQQKLSDSFEKIKQAISNLFRKPASSTRQVKYAASAQDVVEAMNYFKEIVGKYLKVVDSGQYLNQLDAILNDTTITSDPNAQMIIEKYNNYVTELFNPQIRSVTQYLNKIDGAIGAVSRTADFKAKAK